MNKYLAIFIGLLLQASVVIADSLESSRAAITERLDRITDNTEKLDDSARFEALIDLYFDYLMLEYPVFGTVLGVPGQNHRWTDYSLESIAYQQASERRFLSVIEDIDSGAFDETDRLNYALFLRESREGVEGLRFPQQYLQITQMTGIQQDISQFLGMMPANTPADYENMLARMRAVPVYVDQTIELLRIGLEKGVTPPAVTLRNVPEQVENQLVDDPVSSPMLRHFAQMPDSIATAEQSRLKSEAAAIYSEQITPAFRKLHGFLVDTYLPGARQSIAAGDLPDGEAWYAYNVRQMTTTDLTPEEIHQIGLSEVKRIRAEMEAVIERAGFEGSFEEFLDFLRTDPQFFFSERNELLVAYRDIAKRADAALPRLFGTLPRLPYGVEPVPEYTEQTQTTAYYFPGSTEAGRPGVFYANTWDLPSRPKWEMEALTLHEAMPGHHLQISLSYELDELPFFRRFGGETAFIEGWGLYSESLGEEMGFYQDPYSKFGQLTYEMWRAIRLVVDTGMHAMGWTRQQAIDYFIENAGKAEHDITVEVDRYMVMPGQALAYKIGELKIKELRAFAETELGDAFNIRAFHDELLGNGALPLNVLDEHMRNWVAEQKSAGAA